MHPHSHGPGRGTDGLAGPASAQPASAGRDRAPCPQGVRRPLKERAMFNEAERAVLRRAYARQVTFLGNVRNAALERAYAEVTREAYLGPGPWPILRWHGHPPSPASTPPPHPHPPSPHPAIPPAP